MILKSDTRPEASDSSPVAPCPTCGKPVAWTAAAPFRPFCSDRCRLIDLGEWLNEERKIPGRDEDFHDSLDKEE